MTIRAEPSAALGLVAVLLAGGAPAAADTALPNITSPRTITVHGYSLPAPSSARIFGETVVGQARLDEARDATLEQLLAEIAGLQQFRRSDSRSNNPTAQGITLRALGGNAASRAAITVDGVPMTDPFFGYIPFNALAPEQLEDIRLVRGTDIGAFGSGMTGTIELRSAAPGTRAPVEGEALLGDAGLRAFSAGLSTGLGQGFLSLSGSHNRSGGFDTTPDDQKQPWSAKARYKNWSVAARAMAPLGSDIELQGRIAAFRDDRTLRFEGADSMSRGEDASLRLVATGPWAVEALAYLQARDFSMMTVSAGTGKPVLNQRTVPSTGVGAKVEIRPPLPGAPLRIGFDWRRADGRMDEYSILGSGAAGERREAGGEQRVAGGFLSLDQKIGPVTASLGGRLEHWEIRNSFFRRTSADGRTRTTTRFADRSGTAATARAGLMAEVAPGLDLRGALSTGYRLPTLNELYRPYSIFPVSYLANENLSPERLYGAEAGADARLGPVSIGGTVFYNRLKHAITNVTIGPNLRQRQNVPAIVAKGVELTGSARFGDIHFAGNLVLSDVHVDAPDLPFDRMRPAQVAKVQTSATLSWRPQNGARASVTLHHVGTQYEDDRMTDRLPAYLTADARLRVPLAHGFALVARVDNIFDKRFLTRNQGGSMDYGAPRLFAIGLSYGARQTD